METFEQFCKNNMGWDDGIYLLSDAYSEKMMKRNYEIALDVQKKYNDTYGSIDGPKKGDIVEFSDGYHIYKHAKIVESMYGNENYGMMCVCENGGSFTDGKRFSTSGGAFVSIHKSKFKYVGKDTNMVWTWGCNGSGANQGIYFTLDVNRWIVPYDPKFVVRSKVQINGKGKEHLQTEQEFPAVSITNSGDWYCGESFSSIKAFLAWAEYVGYKYDKGVVCNGLTRKSNQRIERKYLTNLADVPKDGKPLKVISNGDVRDAWVVTTDDAIIYYVDHTHKERAKIGTLEYEKDFAEFCKYHGNPLGV